MKKLAKLLAGAAEQIDGSLHPRVSIATQNRDMEYTSIYSEEASSTTLGKRLDMLYQDDEQTKALTEAKRVVLATGATHHGTYTLSQSGQKRVRVYEMTIQAIKDEHGAVTGLMTASVDMTDIYEAQKRLKDANDRLVVLLNQVLDSPISSTARKLSKD